MQPVKNLYGLRVLKEVAKRLLSSWFVFVRATQDVSMLGLSMHP